MRAVWILLACMAACSSEHIQMPPTNPPALIAAYVIDPQMTSCDRTDPRSWGGNFMQNGQPLRCVPDLLNPADAALTFSPSSQLRLVFNEGLDATYLQVCDAQGCRLVHGFVTATLGNAPVDLDEVQSMYDPSGADFKQGIAGTAPPGPAILVVPTAPGFPANGTTRICLDPTRIRNSYGTTLSGPPCLGLPIR